MAPDAYMKNQNKWWDGYKNQKNVILDDLDSDVLGHLLKRWTDKYPVIGEIKNGSIPLVYNNFIVTSNYSIEELFGPNQQIMVDPLKRRFVEMCLAPSAPPRLFPGAPPRACNPRLAAAGGLHVCEEARGALGPRPVPLQLRPPPRPPQIEVKEKELCIFCDKLFCNCFT